MGYYFSVIDRHVAGGANECVMHCIDNEAEHVEELAGACICRGIQNVAEGEKLKNQPWFAVRNAALSGAVVVVLMPSLSERETVESESGESGGGNSDIIDLGVARMGESCGRYSITECARGCATDALVEAEEMVRGT